MNIYLEEISTADADVHGMSAVGHSKHHKLIKMLIRLNLVFSFVWLGSCKHNNIIHLYSAQPLD